MKFRNFFTSLSFLLSLLLICFFCMFQFSTNFTLFINILIILSVLIMMNFMSTAYNFILILSIILIIGFSYLFFSLYSHADMLLQLDFIIQHILLTASLIIIWLLFSTVQKVQEETQRLKEKVKSLEKYEGNLDLLTNSEFKNRAHLISTGTKRRNEKNYYVLLRVSFNGLAKESMDYVISETLLESVRTQFDLVTKIGDHSYMIFLQNTNEQGCLIVINRFFNHLRHKLNLIELPVTYEIINEENMDGLEKKINIMEPEYI